MLNFIQYKYMKLLSIWGKTSCARIQNSKRRRKKRWGGKYVNTDCKLSEALKRLQLW